MQPQQPITQYYNDTSKDYDKSRFNTAYGKYLHRQEETILAKALNYRQPIVLDLGCGTGRFLKYATHGLDISQGMLDIAKEKYPDKIIYAAPASKIPVTDNYFDAVFSFHLFMHLQYQEIIDIINECYRVLKPGGTLIFDIPSALRRSVNKYNPKSWHCQTALSYRQIKTLMKSQWHIKKSKGVLLFPIHRLGNKLKQFCFPIEQLLIKTPIKYLASYYVIIAQKNGDKL